MQKGFSTLTIKTNLYSSPRDGFTELTNNLLDPLGKELADHIQWKNLKNFSKSDKDLYPIAVVGKGSPIILLHGFDSCFLEFRRIVPLLKNKHTLIIPDLYGFGFTPRHKNSQYGLNAIITHLNKVMDSFPQYSTFGLIGASMGGGIGLELARQNLSRINKLLLLSPAGICGKQKKIPRPLDFLGVMILRNKVIRSYLCRQAFANPKISVGCKEEQIASIHLNVPGWGNSLAAFARSGGIAGCGIPQPRQNMKVLWGEEDKILTKSEQEQSKKLLNCSHEEIKGCGHLPHLDKPELVQRKWESA